MASNTTYLGEQMTGGQQVVHVLAALGVRHVFGVPGGQTLAINDALLDSPRVDFVVTRDERGAASMADVAGRMSGLPGVCLATTGPGATNLLTGVGGAYRDSSPMLVLTCNNRVGSLSRDDAQAARHVDIFRPLVKDSWIVASTQDVGRAVAEGARRAVAGCPGPIHLDFTRDALELAVPVESLDLPDSTWLAKLVGRDLQRPAIRERALEPVIDWLQHSRAPVIWAGNGARISGAGQQILQLSEALSAPIITTFNGIGAVPTAHPHVVGPLSRMGITAASEVLSGADLVIAVGNSLNAVSTSRWTVEMPETIVQVDIDPAEIGVNYPERTIPLEGDAAETCQRLTDVLTRDGAWSGDADEARRRWLRRSAEKAADWWDQVGDWPADGPGGVHPVAVVRMVREALRDDGVLIADAGNPGVWTHAWEHREPGEYLKPVGFGNMGFGVPGGIAAALQDPTRPVVVLVGDGSLGMTLAELETAVRLELPVVFVVMNDDGYGNIRQEQALLHGDRRDGVDFSIVDYASVARGLGLNGETAASASEVREALARVADIHGPSLIDVRIDPQANAWTFSLFKT